MTARGRVVRFPQKTVSVRAPRIFNSRLLTLAVAWSARGRIDDPCKSAGHAVLPSAAEPRVAPSALARDCVDRPLMIHTATCTRCMCDIDLTRKEQ